MVISPGTRVGPYEVVSLLGEGGMGRVWRAHHIALNRDDALKVLPDAFAADAERLARFRREAQVLASLNHPNIAHVYGLERADGIQALVMELVEGPTLADRLVQGPIPVDEALPIARQIAEALEAAHEQGIIHRDLKPANIKLRPDGTVKVLDFGLAKALGPASPVAVDATASPTITSPAMTGVGVLLGTAAYMSPEQAKGRAADKRSDIWAFGCVLYEMLTGRRAFDGEDVGDTLAVVLRGEPDWSSLPAETPPAVRRLLRRCLAKDRRTRFDSAAVARIDLTEAYAEGGEPLTRSTAQQPWFVTVVYIAVGVVVGGALAATATWYLSASDPSRVTRMTLTTPGALNTENRSFAITPDGSQVIYRTGIQLWVRSLDQLEPTLLSGPTAPGSVFAAPDGEWIAFLDGQTLKKIPIRGGAPVTLAVVDSPMRGVTWSTDETIVFATSSPATGLQRVSANGGEVTVLTKSDPSRGDADHLWPQFLPGNRAVLFTIIATGFTGATGTETSQIAVFDLESGSTTVVVRGGTDARYVSTGHLIYRVGSELQAVPFDLDRLQVSGTATPVIQDLAVGAFGVTPIAVSDSGTLVYLRGEGPASQMRTPAWVDRNGSEDPIGMPPRPYLYPRISPSGDRVATLINDRDVDLWVWDLARTTLTRVTFDPAPDFNPTWMPDGQRLVFSSTRNRGQFNLYMMLADGTGAATNLKESTYQETPTGVTPDGRQVLFVEQTAVQQRDINVLTLGTPSRAEALIATRFDERGAVVSPDGRWLAYESDSSGQHEIYVRPFPRVDSGLWPVSTAGGVQPVWSRDGRELFYISPDGAVAGVSIDVSGSRWAAAAPRTVVKPGYFTGAGLPQVTRHYDVASDGRFLMLKDVGDVTAQELVVVQNWFEELKRLVPVN